MISLNNFLEKFKPTGKENSTFHKFGNFFVFSPFLFIPIFMLVTWFFGLENFLDDIFNFTETRGGAETLHGILLIFILSPFLCVLFYSFLRIFSLNLNLPFWLKFVYKFFGCFAIFFLLLYSGLGYLMIIFFQFTLFQRNDAEKLLKNNN